MSDPPSADPGGKPPLSGVSPALFALHNGPRYRTPVDLQIAPDVGARYLVLGGCLAEAFPEVGAMINRAHRGDFVLLNNFDSPPALPAPVTDYDFQIVHIPLRTIMGGAYFRLADDEASHAEFLRQTEASLARFLNGALAANTEHKLLTFVLGFMIPQQDPLGRFRPRYDLRNVMHFIERLNMCLAAQIAARQNVYFVDVDQVSACIGKKFCQDDMVWSFTHGTTLSDGDHDHDLGRISPPASMQHHYAAKWGEFFEAVMHEIFAMVRTIGQRDAVKLVVVDLDDTLWRGVAAEGTLGILEGWPMGFMETLLLLKMRGILLAVISRNDENFIVKRWDDIVQGQIALADFAAVRINFRSKAENLAELLGLFNLRPQNVVMVDDNPVERAAIAAAIPGLRTLGGQLYYLKRVLLWSAETQTCVVTAETARRTSMVRAQVQREAIRTTMPLDAFLGTLDLHVTVSTIRDTNDLQMNRALELFNKTNQFNTTGVRYTLAECQQRFGAGHRLHAVKAEDRFTHYGLIGAAWMVDECVDHLVMSCRALGLGIEDAFLSHLAPRCARLRPTEANLACQSIYRRLGFVQVPDDPTLWSRPAAPPLAIPSHLSLSFM